MAKAIIIGAGIGGLSTAIAMGKVGIDVAVFEKTADLKDIGAGIILYPNAVKALRTLDVFESVAAAGSYARSGIYKNSAGKTLVELDLTSLGIDLESIAIHRAELQRALAAKAGRENIHLGKVLTNFEQESGQIICTFADGPTAAAEFLIGADGLHSAVRKQLLDDGEPPYAGCYAWRGVSSPQQGGIADESGLLVFGKGIQFGAFPIGKGKTYWFGAVADTQGVQGRRSKKDVRQAFVGWPGPVNALIEATAEADILAHDLYDRDPSPIWGTGLVTLLGDAAHPMVPFMGQGGCQAMEDSVALAYAIKSENNYVKALRNYELARMRRTANYVMQSRKAQADSLSQSALVCWLRDLILPLIPKKQMIERLHTLTNYEMPSL